jgi:hypothetical protein
MDNVTGRNGTQIVPNKSQAVFVAVHLALDAAHFD